MVSKAETLFVASREEIASGQLEGSTWEEHQDSMQILRDHKFDNMFLEWFLGK